MRTTKMLSVALCMIAGSAVYAQQISVTVDKNTVDFEGTEPRMMNGRVMVPLRGVFEELGARVHWNEQGRQVQIVDMDKRIVIKVGSRQATVNGKVFTLDAPATMVNGRMMVPLRFVSENVGRDVFWHAPQRTVEIRSIAGDTGKIDRTSGTRSVIATSAISARVENPEASSTSDASAQNPVRSRSLRS